MSENGKVVAYYRVSTVKQGQSGLGLEAQEEAVQRYAKTIDVPIIHSFTEVESGNHNERPELDKALRLCDLTGATLVISKLDRLSRNAAFLLTLRDSGVRFIAADMPDANETTVGIMAVLAEDERKRISKRTKEALAMAKKRGTKLGNPNGADALRRAGKGNKDALKVIQGDAQEYAMKLKPVIDELREAGVSSLTAIAEALTERHITTRRGGKWYPATVRNLLQRIQNAVL